MRAFPKAFLVAAVLGAGPTWGQTAAGADSGIPRPGTAFKDCDACPEMVAVPAGSFTMGSPPSEPERDGDEGPQHRVTIAKPFAAGKFEVTFDEWDACVAGGGCGGHRPSDEHWGRGRRPAINVSWIDAQSYVAWLSRRAGKTYRLLTEAEWEYAARAGTTTRWSCGDDESCLDSAAWHHANAGGRTQPVGGKRANAFGLHDMQGNVWEWVEDCWHESYQGAPSDGSARADGGACGRRVLRGGSWYSEPGQLRSADRFRDNVGDRYYFLGFRVARSF